MIRLKLKNIEKEFEAIPGELYDLVIESPSYLYTCIRSFYLEDEEFISLTDDYEKTSISKNILFIKDLFDLNPNSKKILTLIYKQASKAYLNDERRNKIARIQDEINDLLDEISLEFNYPMAFDKVIGIDKIMQNSSFCFAFEQQASFKDSFVTYLKVIQEISKVKFVVTTNITSLLNEEEIEIIKNELKLMGLTILNISYSRTITHESTIIDEDCCEF